MRVRGIDLGTSNSCLAWAESGEELQLLPIPQLDGPARIMDHDLLPSAIYLAEPQEIPFADRTLPWMPEAKDSVIGRWARDLAMINPERAILSAKSWLCYSASQQQYTLPPNFPAEKSWTPVEASAAFLRHLQAAWTTKFGHDASHTVLTVPASFDMTARQLTEDAARKAGLGSIVLLEEPMAAFYAWLAAHEHTWQQQLKLGDLVLVCDVGGGTCDFSLIAVSAEQSDLRLDRLAVGPHLLLGGDNMDLALAHFCQSQFTDPPLDSWQTLALQQQVRLAKEALLGLNAPETWPIAVASRSSNFFAQTLRCELTRSAASNLILDGFFPACSLEKQRIQSRTAGLARIGLPYATEPGITRHLAAFLEQAQAAVAASSDFQTRLGPSWQAKQMALTPSAVLFNGGVFQSSMLRERVLSVLQSWTEQPIQELVSPNFNAAVAIGAAAFARYQTEGRGLRIRAASPRSYYLGLESNQPAIPGLKRVLGGVCVMPQGVEEGTKLSLPEQEFGLWTGDSLSFKLFSSQTRGDDTLGFIVPDAEALLEEVAEMHCTIHAGEEEGLLPVHLTSDLTELGGLQLAMEHSHSQRSWQLEFQVRDQV